MVGPEVTNTRTGRRGRDPNSPTEGPRTYRQNHRPVPRRQGTRGARHGTRPACRAAARLTGRWLPGPARQWSGWWQACGLDRLDRLPAGRM